MRKALLRRHSRLFAFVFLFFISSFAVHAADIYVPGQYTDIQDAIDASNAGDVIHVSGTYINPSGTTIMVDKDVTIQGEPGAKIQTSGTAYLFRINVADITIENFEIEKTDNVMNQVQNIIGVFASNFELANCDIHAQYIMGDQETPRALEVTGGLTGLNIHDNTFSALRQPAYINSSAGTVTNNLTKGTRGWVVVSDANITFTGNTWGMGSEVNYYDIAFIPAAANNYPDIVAVSEANNDATIENQHASYGSPILSIVRVKADPTATGSNGSILNPYPTIAPSVGRVAVGGKVLISSGTYNEQVVISKGAKFLGQGTTKPVVNFTGTPAGKPTLFDISANGVTIDNLTFNVDLSKLKSAIIASGTTIDNINITNNEIGGYGTPASGTYSDRNAVSINYGGNTNYRAATGGVDNIQFHNNVVTANGSSLFRAGIAADEASGSFTGNILQTINHDILVRFSSNGPVSIANNEFHGGGVEIAEPNGGAGATSLTNNSFIGNFANVAAPNTAVLRLKNNQQNKSFTVSANTFNGHEWAISLENFQNVIVEKNSFIPKSGFTGFHHIAVNTKSISTNSAQIVQTTIAANIRNNFFYGSGSAGGTAVGFYNHDADNASFGTFDVQENSFDVQIANAIFTDGQSGPSNNSTFPLYSSLIGTGANAITTMSPWTAPVNGNCNWFGTNDGAVIAQKVTASVDYEPWLTRGSDSDPSTQGFQPVAQSCNGSALDNDGDGVPNMIDCAPLDPDASIAATTYYEDEDGDGFGNPNSPTLACSNTPPDGYVANDDDCDDTKTTYADGDGDGFGAGPKIPCGTVENDDDCNDAETTYADNDGDGFGAGPKAACGVTNNNDCDDTRTTYQDNDGDGFGAGPKVPCGNVTKGGDCDDNDDDNYPNAPEICDGEDNDCDGQIDEGVQKTYYLDSDGDGFGVTASSVKGCTKPAGYAYKGGDCDDSNNKTYPGAKEICDGKDNDCDGKVDEGLTQVTYYRDADGDGWGNTSLTKKACTKPSGYVTKKGDCNDAKNTVYPGAKELCDGLDNDCDGTIDEGLTQRTYYRDADGDGWGNTKLTKKACAAPAGYVSKKGDCNDGNKNVYPGAPVTDNNGIDDDCSQSRSSLDASGNLSLAEISEEAGSNLKVDVYPNPSASYFTLRVGGVEGKPVQLRVTDMMGRTIEAKGNIAANTTQTIGHRYTPGVYFVEAMQEGKKVVVKCVKQ